MYESRSLSLLEIEIESDQIQTVKYKKNPNVWDNNVETYIRLKSNPEYYNDEVCKHGYFRGNETADYVDLVLQKYELYKLWVKK